MSDQPERRADNRAAAKVVPHPAATRQPPERLLDHIRERWQAFASDRLKQLLLELDDDLFARADDAENPAVQELYFNTMRVLRYQADEVRRRFGTTLAEADAQRDPAPSDDAGGDEISLDELTLMDEDVLEQRLAVATMTQRFERARSREVLLAERRIQALQDRVPPDSPAARINLSAQHLAEAFADALAPLDLDLRIRLILFKHFEHQVMEPLAGLFAEFNAMLVAAGVLPDLQLSAEELRRSAPEPEKKQPPPPAPGARSQRPRPDAAPTHAAAMDSASAADEPGAALVQAVQRRAALMRRLPGLQRQRRFSRATSSAHRLDIHTVLDLLEATERVVAGAFSEDDLSRLPDRIDLAAMLLTEAERKGRSEPALNTADEDTVNLLQMLFDLILNDDNLAIPMRALIARLQLPMLRVALADPTFFSSSRHPARRFLNAISRAGIGWSQANEKARDRLYAHIEELVNRAGTDFAGDPALFEQLKQTLDEALAAEAELVRRAEARVIAQERARIAAERTRMVVSRLVRHRLEQSQHDLPADLRHFIETDWQQVMLRAHGDPAAWQSAFAVLRRLTGGGSGPEGSELQAALSQGLEMLAQEASAASAAASEVLSLWVEMESDEAGPAATEVEPDPATAELEVVAAEAVAGATSSATPPDAKALARAEALKEQAWVEIRTRADRLVRCRLAAVTDPAPERCIFVNRRGLRIDTLTRHDIATAIDAGRLRVLDDRQLFDRALEQVIGALRSDELIT